jgi:hypothetical protein
MLDNTESLGFSIGSVPYNTIATNAEVAANVATEKETHLNIFSSCLNREIDPKSAVARRRADVDEFASESRGLTKKGDDK